MTAADESAMRRMQKKLNQRDRRIAGLQRQVQELETALALHAIRMQDLPIDVERAVQRALCNVRMIPVYGLGKEERIVVAGVRDD